MPKVDSKQIGQALVEAGLAEAEQLRGCTKEEIFSLERKFGLGLPVAYRDFLLCAGRSGGDFFVGTDMFYPQLLGLGSAANELLMENKASYRLPRNAFVFLMHQGYQFSFFHAEDIADPAVFHYIEPNKHPTKVADSFTAWLGQCIEDEATVLKMLKRHLQSG